MRFSAAAAVLSLFAASALASTVPSPLHRRQFPGCANNCLANPNLGDCKSGDDTCLCNNPVFVESTFQCIEDACQGQDLAAAIEGAKQLCLAVHVTLVSAAGAEFSATANLAQSGAASSPSATAPASSGASPAPSTPAKGGAPSFSANTAFLGLTALGALALAL
ncbi:hypothetical protein GGX14DRAFT_465723 [Mycena pura]|uniref:CFEM domain-containing protein n=1 Tax=Mycena pura TaxID=153505 RepID=A0AAD6V6F6_9AGAR|nr:hypothetical protein GGX14DRAFT_465723 [Mycena pura]